MHTVCAGLTLIFSEGRAPTSSRLSLVGNSNSNSNSSSSPVTRNYSRIYSTLSSPGLSSTSNTSSHYETIYRTRTNTRLLPIGNSRGGVPCQGFES